MKRYIFSKNTLFKLFEFFKRKFNFYMYAATSFATYLPTWNKLFCYKKGAQSKLRTEKRSFASVATQFTPVQDMTSKAYVFAKRKLEPKYQTV